MMRPVIKLRGAGAAGFALAASLAAPLGAQQRQASWADAAFIGAVSFAAALPTMLGPKLPYATCAPCDSTRVWRLDRVAIGPTREGPRGVSDATLVGTVLGATGLMFWSRRGEPGEEAWTDAVVLTEAVAVDVLMTDWLKVLVHRPRPIRYTGDAAAHPEPDNGRSFPSGHSSVAFAATAATWTMLAQRGEADEHAAGLALLTASAISTAALRVAARRHFPTDVMAGAVLGSLVGWGVAQTR